MKVLITGVCGFAGSTLAQALLDRRSNLSVVGLDNFIRPGSASNIEPLRRRGVRLIHGDVRSASDFETLPSADWVIDCAANASVLAGVDGRTSSRQLVEHNLAGTVNMLEFCKRHRAGFTLLSTSRVYSVPPLAGLRVVARDGAFVPDPAGPFPTGLTAEGVSESFSTAAPVSLYGATKLASEALALEYGATFDFPTYINRCGVLAGAGQFGRPDQGIFAYWIHSWAQRAPLSYIGFGGEGHQVRDCLHPVDLAPLLLAQIDASAPPEQRIVNVAGGAGSARSLKQVSAWCADRFGAHDVRRSPESRAFDIPWLVLDTTAARRLWNWAPTRTADDIFNEIADFARSRPDWLALSAPL